MRYKTKVIMAIKQYRKITTMVLTFFFILLSFSYSPMGSVLKEENTSSYSETHRIHDWLYQLQNLNLSQVKNSKFDLVVMDYSSDGTANGEYTAEEIEYLKSYPCGRRKVIAYMSIGEAEDYRYYWQPDWQLGNPPWLGPENPDWPGCYRVRYWMQGWKEIIYGSPHSYLDKIINAGFDGVYLDVVDAYEYWGPNGINERPTAEQDMVDFVKEISQYAKVTQNCPNFLIIPQNATSLGIHADYLDSISGVGVEDTFYYDDDPQPPSYTEEIVQNLKVFQASGKFVLAVDYVTQQQNIDDFYEKAEAAGLIPYATVRGLDVFTINLGHEPICLYPIPDIKANGSDDPITLNQWDTLTVTVALNNNGITDNADWWLAADTPFGLYFYTFSGWRPYPVPVYQGALFYLEEYEVFSMPVSGLPASTYTFYFGVDTNMDGNITGDSLYYDTVVVNITK